MRLRFSSALVCLAAVVACSAASAGVCSAAVVTLQASEQATISDPSRPTERRVLVRFDLPERLSSGVIEIALLELGTAVAATDSSESAMLDCYPVSASWSAESVDWTHGWISPGGDFDRARHAVCTVAVGDSSAARFDVTRMVRSWTENDADNHGLVIAVSSLESSVLQVSRVGELVRSPVLRVWYAPARDY